MGCQMKAVVTSSVSILMLALPSIASAIDRPDWAFPTSPNPAIVLPPDDGKPKQVPGSPRTYTLKEIDAPMAAPDWFPNEHPPAPKVVVNGNGSTVRACTSCHLSNGHGHPENSRLAGLPAGYIARQLSLFTNGARAGAAIGRALS